MVESPDSKPEMVDKIQSMITVINETYTILDTPSPFIHSTNDELLHVINTVFERKAQICVIKNNSIIHTYLIDFYKLRLSELKLIHDYLYFLTI